MITGNRELLAKFYFDVLGINFLLRGKSKMDVKLNSDLVELIAPEEISKYFDLSSIAEKKSLITLTFGLLKPQIR